MNKNKDKEFFLLLFNSFFIFVIYLYDCLVFQGMGYERTVFTLILSGIMLTIILMFYTILFTGLVIMKLEDLLDRPFYPDLKSGSISRNITISVLLASYYSISVSRFIEDILVIGVVQVLSFIITYLFLRCISDEEPFNIIQLD